VVLAAAGFIGGVEVQKAQGTTQAAIPAQGRPFAPGGGFGVQQQDAAAGTVKTMDGHTLYVQTTDGTLTKVETDANSKVTRTAGSTVGRIQPGDNVVVQGSKAASGTVKATRITATAAGAAGARRGGPPGP
jgi:hypothetical protein